MAGLTPAVQPYAARSRLVAALAALLGLLIAQASADPNPLAILSADLEQRLAALGLSVSDLPRDDAELNKNLEELGYTSAIQQTQLRKAIRSILEAKQATTPPQATRTQAQRPEPPRQSAQAEKAKPTTTTTTKKPVEPPKSHEAVQHLQEIFVCPPAGDESLIGPYRLGGDSNTHDTYFGVPHEIDGVAVWTGGPGYSIYRLSGIWHIGNLHSWPPDSAYACTRRCGDKNQPTPPIGVPFQVADEELGISPGPTLRMGSCSPSARQAEL